MTEQHLLNNGYKKYPSIFGVLYQKKITHPAGDTWYFINVSSFTTLDGWSMWAPSVQGYVDTPIGAQSVRIEGVQWYNTHRDIDTSSHDIRHAEEFFARAVEALGLREDK